MIGDVEFVDQIWWFVSRSAGIVAWVLLSLSVLAGMSISGRRAGEMAKGRALPAGWALDLHRFSSSLSLVFLGVHLGALVLDDFVHFGLGELFVPMMSQWNPAAVAWGIVAFWLVVAVEATSLIRRRIPHRVWRVVHGLSFLVWLTSTVHLFVAGTDVEQGWFRVVQAVVIGLVVLTMVWRLSTLGSSARRVASSAGVGSLPIEEAVNVDQVDTRERRELSA